jgi:hypothetical protein
MFRKMIYRKPFASLSQPLTAVLVLATAIVTCVCAQENELWTKAPHGFGLDSQESNNFEPSTAEPFHEDINAKEMMSEIFKQVLGTNYDNTVSFDKSFLKTQKALYRLSLSLP